MCDAADTSCRHQPPVSSSLNSFLFARSEATAAPVHAVIASTKQQQKAERKETQNGIVKIAKPKSSSASSSHSSLSLFLLAAEGGAED